MDIHINTDEKIQIDYLTLQKMAFLFNALEDGWQIRKSKEKRRNNRKSKHDM